MTTRNSLILACAAVASLPATLSAQSLSVASGAHGLTVSSTSGSDWQVKGAHPHFFYTECHGWFHGVYAGKTQSPLVSKKYTGTKTGRTPRVVDPDGSPAWTSASTVVTTDGGLVWIEYDWTLIVRARAANPDHSVRGEGKFVDPTPLVIGDSGSTVSMTGKLRAGTIVQRPGGLPPTTPRLDVTSRFGPGAYDTGSGSPDPATFWSASTAFDLYRVSVVAAPGGGVDATVTHMGSADPDFAVSYSRSAAAVEAAIEAATWTPKSGGLELQTDVDLAEVTIVNLDGSLVGSPAAIGLGADNECYDVPFDTPCTPGVATNPPQLDRRYPELPEPNDGAPIASPMVPGAQVHGTLATGGDIDMWSIDVPSGAGLRAWTTSRGARDAATGGTSADDVTLSLYAADGVTLIATNDDHLQRPLAQRGLFSKLELPSLAPGTYFLAVQGYDALDVGDYALDAIVVASDPIEPSAGCAGACGGTESEPNDTASASGVAPAEGCEWVLGVVGAAHDEDVWRLDLSRRSHVTWSVTGDSTLGAPLADPQVLVYASDGTTLRGWDDDSGPAFDPMLGLTLDAGSYFVEVRGWSTGTGAYRLTTHQQPACEALAADVTASAATGCVGSSGAAMQIVPRRNEWPVLGTAFTFDIANVPAVAVVMLGFVTLPMPMDLGPLGAPGCGVTISPIPSTLPATPTVPGEAAFSLLIPNDLRFAGARVHAQAIAIDFGANLLGIVVSNRLTATLGSDA